MKKTVLVIPARIGSTRFPKKPFAKIKGVELLKRTHSIAKAVSGVDEILIATDSEEIKTFAEGLGAKAVMTPAECENGTMRVHAVLSQLPKEFDLAVNLQGDAVLTPPWVVEAVVQEMQKYPEIPMATPATRLTWEKFDAFMASKAQGRVSGTLVVFNKQKNAMYFSKGTIPFVRERGKLDPPPIYRHIGLYGYRRATLETYASLSSTELEDIEKLEQLRALEHGIPIRIVEVDYRGRSHWSIDNPEDVAFAEKIIENEGELIL